ncbi:hypothetical protein CRENBAI_024687 [Crenichthys baileyi]|uniref:Uncharacterized protein n=1 Tax=Crenichthys baileyi TaxID=28760 RepID=A0AAV9RPW8_9TELE
MMACNSVYWMKALFSQGMEISASYARTQRDHLVSHANSVIQGLGDASAPAQATEGLGDASAPAHATEGLGRRLSGVSATPQLLLRPLRVSADASAGLGDASAPAHAIEGLGDASAPAHATEGLGDASAPAQATEGPADASAPAHVTEGTADASAPASGVKVFQGFSESLVLVLVPVSPDEGFEDEPPPDPVPEGFKEQLDLILASEPIDEGFEDEAPPIPVSGEFKEQLVLVPVSNGSPSVILLLYQLSPAAVLVKWIGYEKAMFGDVCEPTEETTPRRWMECKDGLGHFYSANAITKEAKISSILLNAHWAETR